MVDSRGIEKLWRWAFSVIPAHAGIQILLSRRLTWIPVFTGMTDLFSAVFLTTLGFIFAFGSTAHGAATWEADWERTIKAAEQEGEFTYYSLGEVGFVSEFEKKFPRIKIRIVQGKGNELLVRIDIPKSDLKPMARRKEGAKYRVTWKAEWMDSEPMQRVVDQALAKSGRKP